MAGSVSHLDKAGTASSGDSAVLPSQSNEPDLQIQEWELSCETSDMPLRNSEHSLTGVAEVYYLPGWIQSVCGFELLCRSSERFPKLARFSKTAETGQAGPMEDANTPERDALFSELALVAGPSGWQDETTEHLEEGKISVYIPRDSMLPLLEGATKYLATIDWDWDHALPRAAFLTFCIARILDDKRVLEVIDQLPPDHQELSSSLSKQLVWTLEDLSLVMSTYEVRRQWI
jgi:hypothetical protein